MGIKIENNAASTLAAGIGISDTSITLASGGGLLFPTLGAGDYFWATLISEFDPSYVEIVKVTARTGDTLTVLRAQEGTAAKAFSTNDKFEMRITAQTMRDYSDAANLTGVLSIAQGGTGQTTEAGVRTTLNVPTRTGGDASGTWGISVTGNAATSTMLSSGRTIGMTGDVTWTSGLFDGSGNVTGTATLANSGVAAGTYTKVTVDAKGRVTGGASLLSGDLPTYTGSLTSSQVTTALGFTPYNSTNPSGYITSSALSGYLPITGGTVTGTLRVDGSTIRQGNNLARPIAQWSSGSTTTGMVIFSFPGGSGNYGMVHCVFDIYEYNGNSVSTVIVGGHNWSGNWYNTGCSVIGYCGKEVRLGFKDGKYCVVFGTSASSWSYGTIVLRKIHNGGYYDGTMDMGAAFTTQQTTVESFSAVGGDLRQLVTPASFNAIGAITQNGNQVLHAGNYNSYSPTLTGGGASGTWGINITGNAATVTNGLTTSNYTSYVAPAGGGWYGSGLPGSRWYGWSVNGGEIVMGRDLPNTSQMGLLIDGCYIAGENNGFWSLAGDNTWGSRRGMYWDGSYLNFTTNSASAYFTNALIGGNQILHAGNYNSYSPSLTGSGASGTWSINVTGNAATAYGLNVHAGRNNEANKVVRTDGNGYLQTGYINSSNGDENNASSPARVWGTNGGDSYLRTYQTGSLSVGSATNGRYVYDDGAYSGSAAYREPSSMHVYYSYLGRLVYNNGAYSGSGWIEPSDLGVRYANTAGSVSGGLTTSNYSSYSSFSGLVSSSGNNGFANATYYSGVRNPIWSFGNAASYGLSYYQGSAGIGGTDTIGLHPNGSTSASGATFATSSANSWVNGNIVLHAGNYTSYSPSLGGSGASGTWGISISGNAATASNSSQLNGYSSAENGASIVLRTASNGYLYLYNWINVGSGSGLFSGTNGAHFKPNDTTSYGTWYMTGSRNGYTGISCGASNGYISFMANDNSNISGVHNQSYGWHFYWEGGTFRIAKNTYGGNMAIALDSSNYTSYSPSLTGGGASGTWSINVTGSAGSASSASSVPASGITGQTGMWTSAARPGPYRLYRNEDNSAYNVQTTWSPDRSGYWSLRGYLNDSYHAPCYVAYSGYADSAGSVSGGLTTSNYGSYALPISGGTMSGTISSTANSIIIGYASGAPRGYLYNDTSAFGFLTNGGAWANYQPVGTNNWHSNGNLSASGNVTAYSDERLKKDWLPVADDFVERLANLKSGTYARIDRDRRQAGVSAQDIQRFLPEVVDEDHAGNLTLAYGNAAMVSAVELAKEIVALKKELAAIKYRVQ